MMLSQKDSVTRSTVFTSYVLGEDTDTCFDTCWPDEELHEKHFLDMIQN